MSEHDFSSFPSPQEVENLRNLSHFEPFEPILNIFEEFFEFSTEKKIWVFHPQKIEPKYLTELLIWPGIFTFYLSNITGGDEISRKLEAVMDDGKDHSAELFNKIMQNALSFCETIEKNKTLSLLLSQYTIISCLFVQSLDQDKKDFYSLSIPSLVTDHHLFKKYGTSLCDFSDTWLRFLLFEMKKDIVNIITDDANKLEYIKSLEIHGTPFIRHFVKTYDNEEFGIINRDRDHKTYNTLDDFCGYEIAMKNFAGMNYDIQMTYFKDDSIDNTFKFNGNIDSTNNVSEYFFKCLVQLVIFMFNFIFESRTNWSDNIKSSIPKKTELDDFLSFCGIPHDLFDYRAFSNELISGGPEYASKKTRELQKLKKEEMDYHIPSDLKEKLLKAHEELKDLYSSVNRIEKKDKKDAAKKDIVKDYNYRAEQAKKYFKDHGHKFKVLEFADIKYENFQKGNEERNVIENVLYNVAKRHGKDIPKTRITKILGLR